MKNRLIQVMLVLSLLGCSQQQDASTERTGEHKALYKAVNEPLDKAKQVETQILDDAARQHDEIDRATGGNE